MIFKTLNGDLTVFNKTLISTKDHLKALQTVNATVYNKNGAFNLQGLLVNSSQSVSTFTKLNNAFKAYNGNLSKSTQLQNAYVQAVGKQNVTLGNYLAGLNGAKASMGGYVKSLVATKAASIGLQAASIALNTAISMGITLAISALVSQISKWIHAQEEARQKAIELTNSYKEQKDSLDSQIEKYKELKETLDNGNLSTDETRSIKEQLLEIQKSLIESYGDEASNIDLVNGKYKEQLGLLSELSKEKATDYVAENRDVFEDAKEELEKVRTYTINGIVNWNTLSPKTEDQQALLDFIESYSELFDINADGSSNYASGQFDVRNLVIKADVESADEIMRQFYDDLDQFGKDNDIDVSGILEGISGQLKKTTADEFKEYRTIYDEFMKAEIVRNDTLRPLYQQSIQAVEDYNNALSSGEGVAEAKANLSAVQQSVQNAASELEGSQEVFDGIYDGINKDAESAYNLTQAFENNESVKGYAEQLRGLTDIDLQAINFEDSIQSPGEEAFGALIDILGLSEDEVQNLIDKLVELGYVQGEIVSEASDMEEPKWDFSETITQLDELKDKFSVIDQTYAKLFDADTEIGFEDLSSINEAFKDLDGIDSFIQRLQEAGQDTEAVTGVMQDLISAYLDYSGVLNNVTEENSALIEQFLTEMGIENAHEIVLAQLSGQTEALALQKQFLTEKGYELIDATLEEIVQFLNEADASDEAKASIAQLALAKLEANNTVIDTSADIENVIALANAAGASATAIAKFKNAMAVIEDAKTKPVNGVGGLKQLDYAQSLKASVENSTYDWEFQKLDARDFKVNAAPKYTPKYSGGSSTKKAIDDTAKDAKKSAEKAAKEIENQFEGIVDFFDRRSDVLNDALSLLKTNLDNVTGSFAKNKLVDAQLGITEEKFKNYSDALNMYTQKANEALSKLPSDIAAKIKDGAVDLTTFIGDSNKDVVEAIKDYEQWADKVADCKQELAELRSAIRQLELDKFNNIMEDFKNQFDLHEDGKGLISKQIDLLKEAGQLIGESFFTSQIDQSKKQLELLENEKAQLVEQMNSAIGSGRVD